MLYILYILTILLVNTGLLYLLNAIASRINGQTLVSHADPKSPLYAKLRQRTGNVVIFVILVLLLGLAYTLFLEIRKLQHMNTSSVASPLLFIAFLAVAIDIIGIWLMSYLNKISRGHSGKRTKE